MIADAELFERWRGGDVRSGETFARRHFGALSRFFRNKVSGDVDDLIAETLLRVASRLDAFRGESTPRAFLFGVARLVLFEHYRMRDRARAIDFGVTSVHDLDPSPSQVVAKREELRLLHEALRRIPLELQVVLELLYWEQASTAEIAAIIAIPVGTVKSRLHRARRALAAALAPLEAREGVAADALAALDALPAER
ncbi:MAG: sigma-70 family RNA polymerase sigma factor [Myxococcales bacterium]|nr:sigma-70 family RNA polymerase sigma factor [Myxococcales bacterium]